MKAILRSINNFSCKLKQSNNLKYNISPKIRSNKFKNISGNGNIVIEDAIDKNAKDYKIYGNTVQKKLPDEYTQVDYIKSSGNQYIDTGVNADSNLSIKMNLSSDYHIQQRRMGAIKNDNGVYTRHHITLNASTTTNYIASFTGRTNSEQNLLSTIDDNKHYLNLDIYNKKVSVDEETPIDLTLQPFDTELNYWLFARNSNNSTNMSFAIMQIYDCKMYYSDVLVRDFIPCYRNSDNEVGLYDLVNNVFYTNQGTGSFTYGNMAPTPDAPIEMVSYGDRTKNLFDGEYEVGGYDISTGEKAVNTYQYRNKNFIKVKPNTSYTFSLNEIKITETPRYYYYDKNKNFLSSEVVNGNFATPNNCYFVNWNSSALKTNYPDGLTKPMIEEGSTATPYEPYGYKIPINVNNSITNIYLDEPLRKIGEYSDYIDFANGKIVRKIKEIILDGSLSNNFNNPTINNNTIRFDIQNILLGSLRSNQNKIICDKFISLYGNNNDYEHIRNSNTSYNNVLIVYINKIRLNLYTREEFINWLSSNPVTVDYVLETPTIEDIGLPNINLIEGKNIITIGTELESIIEVEYYSKEIIDISNYKYNLRKVED